MIIGHDFFRYDGVDAHETAAMRKYEPAMKTEITENREEFLRTIHTEESRQHRSGSRPLPSYIRIGVCSIRSVKVDTNESGFSNRINHCWLPLMILMTSIMVIQKLRLIWAKLKPARDASSGTLNKASSGMCLCTFEKSGAQAAASSYLLPVLVYIASSDKP